MYYPTIETTRTLQNLHKSSRSYVSVPLCDTEKAGGLSFFNWHCGIPMQSVFNLGDVKGTPKAHICMICKHRHYPPVMKKN